MGASESVLPYLCEPQLSGHATSAHPVWLWSADGTQIIWANAGGAAIFGADNTAALASIRFDPGEPAAAQITRLAATLLVGGPPRLERLRGFGTSLGGTLVCACSRVTLSDRAGILVVAGEFAGPNLALAERVRRLLAGNADAIAVFTPDDGLVYASSAAAPLLDTKNSLAALGARDLAATALESGRARGASAAGEITLVRLGEGANRVLLVTFSASEAAFEQNQSQSANSAASDPERAAEPARIEPPMFREPPQERRANDGALSARLAELAAVADSADKSRADERRHPLRFVWQMDADGRFSIGSDEFIDLVGPTMAAALGRPWNEIASEFGMDPNGEVARAVASRDTWSGVTVAWPVEAHAERLTVEMSGLPIYDRERAYRGYRGFGVCRDVARISALAARRSAAAPASMRDDRAASTAAPKHAAKAQIERPALSVVAQTANVVPFRASQADSATLSPVERNAFDELARKLSERLSEKDDAASASPPPLAAQNKEPAAPPLFGKGADEQEGSDARPILDLIPVGVLIYQHDHLLFANAAFLHWAGYDTLSAFEEAGGIDSLFVDGAEEFSVERNDGQLLVIESPASDKRQSKARLFNVPWNSATAMALIVAAGESKPPLARGEGEIAELESILDTKEELLAAKQQAEKESSAKSAFLAKVSHEIRTPLNAIIGFSEIMMQERFGPVGNERYRDYLKDIHASGEHLISLINDLLDLSKIEAGKLELSFGNINLNDLTEQCVAIMQPQANREHIIIRTSLPQALPQIVADARSVRQIILNLLSNSVKFTNAGGQVIVSTTLSDDGDVALHVRDTGGGMSEKEIERALEPFRQLATSAQLGGSGTGLGLPLTKALAEANRASFAIKSAANAGTLAEIIFPASRIQAAE
jgi:signal transduction histidine kinase